MKSLLSTLIVSIFLTISVPAANIGQLGILQDTANGGINPATSAAWAPGDTYRLIFLTSGVTDTSSTDITTYNEFVQGLANSAGLGGASWFAVGSTATDDARDNTGTNPNIVPGGVAFFKTDGITMLATDNSDLWSNGVDAFINVDETGSVVTTNTLRIATGSNANGTAFLSSGRELGGADANVRTGHAEKTGTNWMVDFNASRSGRRMFAMSEELTVVPEPSSLMLLGAGSLLAARRRR